MFFELDNRLLTLALKEIEDHTYQKLCLYENSNVNPMFSYELELKEGTRKHSFLAGFNANADYVNLSSNKFKYYKFKLPIDIMSWGDKKERKQRVTRPAYQTVYERGFLNRKGVEVYIDNKKLPDFSVLVSVHNGAFDLYVPDIFGVNNDSVIRVLLNEYQSNTRNPYCTYFVEVNESHGTKFAFNVIDGRKTKLSNDNMVLYINGKAQASSKFHVTSDARLVYLTLQEKPNPKDIIELVHRPYRIRYEEHTEYENRAIIFPEDFLKDLPVSPELMEIYVDGERLLPNDLDIVNARHYRLPDYNGYKPEVLIYVHYEGSSVQKHHDYFDDVLKFFKFKDDISVRNIIEQKYGLVNTIIPDYIKDEEFPPEFININQDYTKLGLNKRQFTTKTIEDYIRINSDNFRRLLRYFSAKNDIIIDIDEEKYIIGTDYDRVDTSKEIGALNGAEFNEVHTVFSMQKPLHDYEILTYVGNTKIYRHEVVIKELLDRLFIYVPKRYLQAGSYMRFEVVKIYNRKQKYFIRDMNIYGDEYFFNASDLGRFNSLEDILVYKKDGNGWIATTDEEIEKYLIDNNERVYIKTKAVSPTSYMVFNQKFFNYQLMNIPSGNVMDRIIFNYDSFNSEHGVFIPKYAPKYLRNFFTNQSKQSESIDYTIINQTKDAEVSVAKAVLRTIPEPNTFLESYNIEVEQYALNIMGWVDTEIGLIYVNDMPVPFDLSYISVYINGVYMRPEDLISISDNVLLITHPDIKLPIHKAEIIILIDVPKTELQDWIDIYEESDKYNDYVQDVVDPDRDKASGSNIDDLIIDQVAPVIPEWVDSGKIVIPSFPPGWGLGVIDNGDGTVSHIGERGIPILDSNGNIIYLDEDERIPIVDANGNRMYVDDDEYAYVIDNNTLSLIPSTYDENGNEYKMDEFRNLVLVDKDGDIIKIITKVYPLVEFPDVFVQVDPLYEALIDGWKNGTIERRIDASRDCFAFNDVNLRVLMDEKTLSEGVLRIDASKRVLTENFRIDASLPEFLKQNPEILAIVHKAIEDGILPVNFTTLSYEEFEELEVHNDIYPEDLQRVMRVIGRQTSDVIRIEPDLS